MAGVLQFFDEVIGGVFNIIWAVICVPVYAIIRNHFNVFIKIAELDILSSTDVTGIYKRITMIITIVMAFYVTFNIVKYTISPDTIGDKEKGAGKLVYRIIIAILLIAFVPEIFSMGYKLQNRLIKTQVFSKVILGQEVVDYKSYGSSFAADTFSAFYRVDYNECGDSCDAAEDHVSLVIEGIRQGGSTIHILRTIWGQMGFSSNGKIPDGAVEFDGLFALIFGCFAIYVIFLYSVDVAVRYVQLLYLQIIAPIAIMGYISPGKDNMFQKWGKQCLTTYLDLFIRLSILYFAMLLMQILGRNFKIYEMTSDGKAIGPIAYIFFIMGVLIFLQRAPKLLEELFPKSGSAGIGFGLEWKTRGDPLKKSINTIKKPIAATAGAIASTASTVKSLKSGKLKEALKGRKDWGKGKKRFESALAIGKSAWQGGRNAAKSNSILGAITNRNNQERDAAKLINNGGSLSGHDLRGLHYENEKERFKQFIDGLNDVVKSKKTVQNATAETKSMKAVQALIANWNEQNIGNAEDRATVGKEVEKALRVYAANRDAGQFETTVREALTVKTNLGSVDTRAFAAIMNKFNNEDKDSTEMTILKKELEEAHNQALDAKGADGKQYTFVEKMPDGTTRAINYTSLEDFAKNIGKIEKAATEQTVETQYSPEYKEANANANAPGKKDGDK